ncbi:MAG: HAMP domain-containing protein [Endomicrobiia bacterium]
MKKFNVSENFDLSKLLQRKHFIIKPEIQLKYLIITIVLIILTGIAVFSFVNLTIASSTKLENLTRMDIAIIKDLIFKSVVSVLSIITVIVILEGILFLHKLTGPLFVIEKMMRMVADGDLTLKLKLRKGDELQSLAEEFQNMVDSLNKNFTEEKSKVENIKKDLNDIISKIGIISNEEIKIKITSIQNQLSQLYSRYKL